MPGVEVPLRYFIRVRITGKSIHQLQHPIPIGGILPFDLAQKRKPSGVFGLA